MRLEVERIKEMEQATLLKLNNFLNHLREFIPLDIILNDNPISDQTKLNFITNTLPLVCMANKENKHRLKRIANYHTISREEKIETINIIRKASDEAKKCFINIDNASDEEIITWLNKSSRYIEMFTRPFIK